MLDNKAIALYPAGADSTSANALWLVGVGVNINLNYSPAKVYSLSLNANALQFFVDGTGNIASVILAVNLR